MQISHFHSPETMLKKQKKILLFVTTTDDSVIYDLRHVFDEKNYQLVFFSTIDEMVSACVKERPLIIILDVVPDNNDRQATNMIQQLKNDDSKIPHIIYIAENANIEAQLLAVRHSVCKYFVRPLKASKLKRSVDSLINQKNESPYRALLIDDEEALLRLNAEVLRNGGMQVETLSKPLQVLEKLEVFQPDVIVIDMRMPDCTGYELAQLIRLNDDWAFTPVMFLSAEMDPHKHVEAMNIGADDFLVKPVDLNYLFSAIYARAKRARKSKMLNDQLKNLLRENKYQLVTMDEHAIVSSADVKGNITSINDRFCKISGYSREELIGKNHRMLKSGFHSESFYKKMWSTLVKGKVWRGTICNRKKDGGEYWVESTIVPFLNAKGKPYKYVSARTDISALRKSEERQYRSQTFANIGTWDWNIVTGELYWSDRIGPLFGYENNVPETSYENFLAAIHPDDRQLVITAIEDCVQKGVDYNIEHRVVWPDGSVHWVLERGNVLRSETGEALHMLGVVQDINKLKSTQLQLMQACNEAESANQAKSQFLSSMSHELRTPMNAILGFGQLLKMEAENINDSQNENVDEIIKAGRHLLELINEVLDLSKIESGRLDLSIEAMDLSEVIIESIQTISSLAKKRGIEIEIKQNNKKVDFKTFVTNKKVVKADKVRMRQVLLNLMSNAVKYNNENGKIIVTCEITKSNKWRTSVKDTGNGLSASEMEKLFTAFERMGAEQSEVEGSGIGLVITKKIVGLMNGEIGVESEEGKGSTFWVEFDAEKIENKNELKNKNLTDKEAVDEASVMTDKKYNVLYIEDNPANLRLITQLIARRNEIELSTSPDPVLGLELAVANLPDLILLDINLPGMSGFEVLKKLKENDDTKNIKVIAISANAMQADIEKGMEAGFDEYVTKPIDVSILLKTVDNTLQGINK